MVQEHAQWPELRQLRRGAFVEEAIAVRDSKNPTGPALIFTAAEWDAFVSGAKDGEFDR